MANSEFSIINFDDEQGNIHFSRGKHSYVRGKCIDCGAPEGVLDRGDELENHAYQFIHKKKVFPMKFDVIIGNPPYQLQDAGESTGASPIYHLFFNQAKSLSPKYISMIIPARWYAGGKGLDTFRSEMLNDTQLRKLVDFENSSEAFPGVDVAGGICYFLWEKDSSGECEVTNFYGDQKITTKRQLNEFEIFIRNGKAVPIIRKALKFVGKKGQTLSQVISARKPFGMPTNYVPKEKGVPCWFIQRIGLSYAAKEDVVDADKFLNKWKLLIPKAPIAGQTDFSKPVGFYYEGNTRIAKPGECCTESWLVACAFDTKEKVISFRSYLFSKIARFLLLQAVISQDVTRKNFCFVPDMIDYDKEYTDEYLIKLFGITNEEWLYIDSKISAVGKE
jgi:site-specific DNA-methyltransferase (adenine-specific)